MRGEKLLAFRSAIFIVGVVLTLAILYINGNIAVSSSNTLTDGKVKPDTIVDISCYNNICLIKLNESKFVRQGNVLVYHKYSKSYIGYYRAIYQNITSDYKLIYQEVHGKKFQYDKQKIVNDNEFVTSILSESLGFNSSVIDKIMIFDKNGSDNILVVYLSEDKTHDCKIRHDDILYKLNNNLLIKIDRIIYVLTPQSYNISKIDAYNLYKHLDTSRYNILAIGYSGEFNLPVVVINSYNEKTNDLIKEINNIAKGDVVLIVDHNPLKSDPAIIYENYREQLLIIIALIVGILTVILYKLYR